jgi:hypothetical protein
LPDDLIGSGAEFVPHNEGFFYIPTMFKTAATKIAHNSTLPALAENKDLRPLQDLPITAEKAVIVSIHIVESCTYEF